MHQKCTIAFVDDEKDILESIADYFHDTYDLQTYGVPGDALAALAVNAVDILVVDERMPLLSGLALLEKAASLSAYSYGILLTAYGDRQILKRYTNAGLVRHVLEKPLDLKSLAAALEVACAACSRRREGALDRAAREAHYIELLESTGGVPRRVIGLDRGLKEIHGALLRYASVDENVLITGETGTGKEVIAHALHQISRRSKGPFVKVNCGAIPESLIESELFGYARGAFSGAARDTKGKIEVAAGGTLFLDEVSELKIDLQSRLLHVVQDRALERLGSTERVPVDFRLIAATNRDLPELVARGTFRQDLYFRLAVLPLQLPPLRERTEDIQDFALYFLEQFCSLYGRAGLVLSAEAMAFLKEYPWPGNVRELESALKRAAVLSPECDGMIGKDAFGFLADHGHGGPRTGDYEEALDMIASLVESRALTLEDLETGALARVITRHGGNVLAASRATGIPKDRLYRAMKRRTGLKPRPPE